MIEPQREPPRGDDDGSALARSGEGAETPRWRVEAARWAPAATLGALLAAMLAFAGASPDPLTDFGGELYTAWRLSAGQVLARDVFVGATGPLSSYANAALFAVFGPGIRTLVVANVLVVVAIAWVSWALVRELAGRGWATVACAVFLAVFAFGQYMPTGIFNYVVPYSHGLTHGLLLALVAILLRWRFARTGAPRDLVAASFVLGLILLTKPELFIASAGAAAVDLALAIRATSGARARLRLAGAASLPALLPAALSLAALAAVADRTLAWQATFAPWIGLATPITRTPFYAATLGLDDPAGNALRDVGWLAVGATIAGTAAWLDVRAGERRARWIASGCAAAGVVVLAWTLGRLRTAFELPRGLTIAVACGGALVLLAAWRAGPSLDARTRLHAGLVTFAGLLLLKLGLYPRIHQYGFVLAMPATLLVVAWMGSSIPRHLRARGGSGLVLQSVVATSLALLAIACLRVSSIQLAAKTVAIGSGPDAFRADRRGVFLNAVTDWLAKEGDPGGTLAVFPEGVMINYLARRQTPSPYLAFMPDAIAWKGERTLLAPFVTRPPKYVVILSRNASEHGARTFGVDYAVETYRWIDANYEPVGEVGGSPLDPAARFGVRMLRYRGAGPPASAGPR